MRIALMLSTGLTVLSLTACGTDESESAVTEAADTSNEIAACAQRGVAYFKEIGSYPTLSSEPNVGRAAEDVALERCQSTTTAF